MPSKTGFKQTTMSSFALKTLNYRTCIFQKQRFKLPSKIGQRFVKSASSGSDTEWSDIEDSNYKRSLRRLKSSGFESESDQIANSLSQLSSHSGSEWDPWNDFDSRPRGELTGAMPLRSLKGKSIHNRKNFFIDCKSVQCIGGRGGDGKIAFLRLFRNPLAGPSGGDGGNGGHVVFEASHQVKSLNKLVSIYRGELGEAGMEKDMHGKSSEDTYVQVPIGTLVKDAETLKIVADLDEEGTKFLAARGGAGGKGNHYFLSDKNRHPRVAEVGADGETKTWILEMKIVAHAGLVGFPNAGKSTLLQAISRAKPKIASYPFTTLKPHVGIIQYDDYEQLAVADLPGIVVDAHKNRGLGIAFLKHIERCVCLFYVIDISQDNPWEQLTCLMHELEQYKTGLSKRPNAVVCNKIDAPNAQENLELFKERFGDDFKIISISAKYGHNLTELLKYFRELYDLYNYSEERSYNLSW